MSHEIYKFFKSKKKINNYILCAFPLIVIVYALLFMAFTQHSFAQEQSKKTVGISVPLSGNSAALGRQFVAGLRLAQSTLPNSKNVEFMITDDGCSKELGLLAAQDIRNSGAQLSAGYLCNEPAVEAANLYSDSQLPMLISGARSIRLLRDRKRYSWNIWQMAHSDHEGADAAFEYLLERWQTKPYAIVDDGTVYGRTLADEFRARMEEAGSPPQFVDNFRPAQSTQAGLIRRLIRADVEAVYLAASADDVALIGRNMLEFGGKIEIATADAVAVLPFIEDNKGIPVGLIAVMQPLPEDLPRITALLPQLEKAELEPEPYLLSGYATAQIIFEHLSTSAEHEIGNFASRKFETVLGDIEFDESGKNISKNYFLFRWNGKSFSRLE